MYMPYISFRISVEMCGFFMEICKLTFFGWSRQYKCLQIKYNFVLYLNKDNVNCMRIVWFPNEEDI